nr:DNA mismatch repair protein MLH3 isoform X1 [Ipomoea batatas]
MRSRIILHDLIRVMEELVFNSFDAGANKVSIAVGVGTCYVKVVDDDMSAIGSFLGVLVKIDERNFDSIRLFYLVRVSLNVSKPLRKKIELKKDVGE